MAEHKMFDREKVHLNLARLKKGGKTFEVVVDPDKAIAYKKHNNGDIRDVLHAEHIYTDAHKGTLAPEQDMEAVFATTEPLQVAQEIIQQGEIQLTAEYREQLREEKQKRIVEIIRINSIDPKTKLPHPAQRIAAAMEEAKVRIDEHKTAEDQVDHIVHEIASIIPIKFSVKQIQMHLTGAQAGKLYGTFKHYGKLVKEEWNNDGSWTGTIELPAGLQTDFLDEVNEKTQGDADIKIIEE